MGDLSLGNSTGVAESSKLIIQRRLGHKVLIPGIAQWRVNTEQKDECWICAHSIMTVFIWSQRIGQMASSSDPI